MDGNFPERDNNCAGAHDVEETISDINSDEINNPLNSDKENQGLFELVYGTLFDPVRTFKRISGKLPLGWTVLIFSLVKVLSVTVFWYTLQSETIPGDLAGAYGHGMEDAFRMMLPAILAVGLVYEYVKWFVYSGTLHLLADLAGGSGRAAGVLVVTGLAALPSLLFLPVQILITFIEGNWAADLISFLIVLAALIWGFILVIIGMRETQGLSTGSAVLVALIPAIVIVLAIVFFVVMVVAVAYPLANMAD